MYYNMQIPESENNLRVVWRIVRKEKGKYSSKDERPSVIINDYVIKTLKRIVYCFSLS
jgi:hypothetical protein